ncbi:hypothetical protein FJ970_09005 [Mesorhizobium sp. B2-1-8]|uniref:hypothetical protein n=1 Tax=Mesorhizobium sp. B2-1-8 TaxID=2589967 RepID=UPI00112CBABC|nr:hypothetical protein [Mesorhizobium sp. B2-1-8]UCI21070.1 hypothetical protein FJ970_09005 [Mesorhizobium sp. B2-1-8]
MAGDPVTEDEKVDALALEEARITLNREIKREKGKYNAAASDRLSTAFVAAGLITPSVSAYLRAQALTLSDWGKLFVVLGVCLVVSIVLHLYGRETLEDALK